MWVGARARDDRSVHHVRRSGDSAELAGDPGAAIVQWLDVNDGRSEQACEPHLPSSVAPSACPTTPAGTTTFSRRWSARARMATTRRSPRSKAISAPASNVTPLNAGFRGAPSRAEPAERRARRPPSRRP